MDQGKIGKFIAFCRKEKNMTQQELANRLNVTDRAVGNWENGRRLPDYSILPNLCNELGISINELFAGEYIKAKELKKKSENNLLNAINLNRISNKRYKRVLLIFIILIGLLSIFPGRALLVNYGYMINDELSYIREYNIGEENIKGEVNIKKYTDIHKDFDIGANKYGYAVFKDPDKAFKRFKILYGKGIRLIQREFYLLPLTNFNFRHYKTYGWQVTTGTEEEKEQARFVSCFLDIYEESFNSR